MTASIQSPTRAARATRDDGRERGGAFGTLTTPYASCSGAGQCCPADRCRPREMTLVQRAAMHSGNAVAL